MHISNELIEQVDNYFNFLEDNKEKLVVKKSEIVFTTESKKYILYNLKEGLEDFFRVSNIQEKVKLESFLKLKHIEKFIKKVDSFKSELKSASENIKDEVNLIFFKINDLNSNRLKSQSDLFISEFLSEQILIKDINFNNAKYNDIFSRLTKIEFDNFIKSLKKYLKLKKTIISNFESI